MKNWHQFVFYDNKLSNSPLSLVDVSQYKFVCLSAKRQQKKNSQWAHENFCSYRKNCFPFHSGYAILRWKWYIAFCSTLKIRFRTREIHFRLSVPRGQHALERGILLGQHAFRTREIYIAFCSTLVTHDVICIKIAKIVKFANFLGPSLVM